jgi:hypothetical protein
MKEVVDGTETSNRTEEQWEKEFVRVKYESY